MERFKCLTNTSLNKSLFCLCSCLSIYLWHLLCSLFFSTSSLLAISSQEHSLSYILQDVYEPSNIPAYYCKCNPPCSNYRQIRRYHQPVGQFHMLATTSQHWHNDRPLINEPPHSSRVIDMLSNPTLYNEIAFSDKSICGVKPICPAYEGEVRVINGRDYVVYCYNAAYGSYIYLGTSKTQAECESNCHKNSQPCNGFNFNPVDGSCYIIYSTDAQPYIWDDGRQKVGAVPANKTDTAFTPGMLCQLPASDNQVWKYGETEDVQFKMSCTNQFNVPTKSKKVVGIGGVVKNVIECAEECGKDHCCFGFHYYQPVFPGGRLDGMRNCELIMENVGDDAWTPLAKPNQYLAGLKVSGSYDCSDDGWDKDKACRVRRSEWVSELSGVNALQRRGRWRVGGRHASCYVGRLDVLVSILNMGWHVSRSCRLQDVGFSGPMTALHIGVRRGEGHFPSSHFQAFYIKWGSWGMLESLVSQLYYWHMTTSMVFLL